MLVDMYGNVIRPNTKDLMPETFEKAMPTVIKQQEEERKPSDDKLRRRGQWFSNYGPSVNNIGSLNGTLRKPLDTPPFMMLRQVAKESLIDRAIINRRVEDIKGLSRRISVPGRQRGWRVVHKRFDDPQFDASDHNIQRRCREMEEMLDKPHRLYHKTFRDFLTVSVQEELIIDRRAMVISRDRKGRPVDFYLLPGDTILPVLYVLMPWMAKKGLSNERVARMMLTEEFSQKAGTSIDITDAAYIQEVDGQVVGAWREDEIDVEYTNPSGELNRWGFGASLLEQSLQATALLLNMFNFNKDLFRPGFPSRMLVLSGEYSAEGLSTFERQILGQGNPGSPKSKMPVLPGPENMRAQVLDLTNTPSDMQFEQFFRLMSSVKCSFFGMHPSRLNLSETNPQGIVMTSSSAITEVSKTVNEEGLYSLLESGADWLTRSLIHPYYDDLMLIFDGLHEESEAMALQSLQIESMWSTKNEIRARRNLPPLSSMEGGDSIMDGLWLQWVNLKKQEKAQKEAQKQYEKGSFSGAAGQQQGAAGQQQGEAGQQQGGGTDEQAALAQIMGGGGAPQGAQPQGAPPEGGQAGAPGAQPEGGQLPPEAMQAMQAAQGGDQGAPAGAAPGGAVPQGQEGGQPPAPPMDQAEQGGPQQMGPDQIRQILSSLGRG